MMFKCGKKKGKKGYFALAILLGVVLMAGSAFADGGLTRLSPNSELQTYVCSNTTATTKVTSISTDTISPNYHRIIGFTLQEYDPTIAASRMAGLYDATSSGYVTNTYIFDEAEAVDNVSYTRWYPYPKRLSRGLTVAQGTNTIVVVYYEDMRKF